MDEKLKPDTPEDDNPEWTAENFARAKGIDHFPELKRIVMRGRPPLPEEQCKKRVTMYLDRDVIEALKQDGRGWQTRANATLRAALGLPK